MSEPDWKEPLRETLEKMGLTEEEIGKVMERVRQYDEETSRDSIMDSLGSGTLNLDSLIQEALGDEGDASTP